MRAFWKFWNEVDSRAEQRGMEAASRGSWSPEKAAFLVNLDKPTENPQHKDLQAVEDFLHGYYRVVIERLEKDVKQWYESMCIEHTRATHAEEVLDAYKNSQSRPKRNKRTAKANRRSARSNTRRN